MARLKAVEKVLFYPTPMEIMTLIASNITPGKGSLLDPCCGTGEPVALLGERLGLTTYGVELHPQRYLLAQARLDHCINGAREFLQVQGQFNVVFDNPPYDDALGGERMELTHLRHDLEVLIRGGLGIWVVPETILTHHVCFELVTHLQQVTVRRFPQPEYDRFKQVVVFGLKREKSADYTYTQAMSLHKVVQEGAPVLTAGEFTYRFYETEDTISQFQISFPEAAQVLTELEEGGVQTSDAWQTFTGMKGGGFEHFQPVLSLTAGHTAMVIAAGIVNGTEIEIEGQKHLIKGSTTKQVTVTKEVEEEGSQATTVIRERERLVQVITALNLENGTLATHNSLRDKDGFADFLLTHQQTLVHTIEQNFPPLFNPDQDMPTYLPVLTRVQAPGKLPGQKTVGGLLPAQQVRAAALAKRLAADKAVILVGEMGVGKTATAQAIAALIGQKHWKLVVVCPSQVAPKWVREAKQVLAQFGVSVHLIGEKRKQADGQGQRKVIAKPVLDVQRAMAEPNPSVLVVSYEVAKNGPRWEHAVAQQRKVLTYQVETEEPIPTYPYKRVVEKKIRKVERVLCCPDCGHLLANELGPLTELKQLGNRKHRCSQCGAVLWQQLPFTYGGRVAIADYLNRHYSGRYYLLLDEAHTTKGADTDAAYASADLIAGAKKVVAMTGTIYAGKASSIFYLLYRLFPHFRRLYAYNEVQRFVEHHGLLETITKIKGSRTYHSAYGYSRENVRVRELPGVSPGMVTLLLENTAFLKLADVGFVLPPYMEERLPIPLDDRLQTGLDQLARVYTDAVKLAREGKPGLLSAWLYASLGWLDCPVSETLTAKNDDGEVVNSYPIGGFLEAPDELLDEPLLKDQALLDLVEAEIAQNRGVGVFFAQVNRRDWMQRVSVMLARRGIYSEILRQETCPAGERETWYRNFVARCRARGQEPVLLANGSLLKEGLDLVELPTLIETGIEYRINDLRQRDRRSWRLIQDKPVKVVFLYYENTWQETALQLIAAKLKAALMVEGNLAEGLAAMDVDDDNLLNALMKAVANGRSKSVEWSGLQIAAVEKTVSVQAALLPEVPPVERVEIEVMRVEVGQDAVQLSWSEFLNPVATPSRPAKRRLQKQKPADVEWTSLTIHTVEVAGGGVQYSFL